MVFREENFYAAWRSQCLAFTLREDATTPPEKLLQSVWLHQRLKRGGLVTASGQALQVLHPGFINTSGGPDFRGAVLRFGDAAPVSGDVEVDLLPASWRAHGHHTNPCFKNVILHVIWEQPARGRTAGSPVPAEVLSLKPFLDAPISELASALEQETGLPENLRGRCSTPLRELTPSRLGEILRGAAQVRLANKAAAILARARICGWEQALWENLFRVLGYRHNIWPMQCLAETKGAWLAGATDALEIQSRLLGVAGLLPAELTRSQKSPDTYLRRAWDFWWRDRDAYSDITLPRHVWKFQGLRPLNHPQRRLALAAHWLASESLPESIEAWIVDESHGDRNASRAPARGWLASLHKIFHVESDAYWSWHSTINSAPLERPTHLLGESRVTDLAVNAVLPWLWIRAKEGGNTPICREIERRYLAWPAAEDNSTLKLARQRLLGSRAPDVLNGAAEQQGLLQIVRDFCEHSNAICSECRFPDLLQNWRADGTRG